MRFVAAAAVAALALAGCGSTVQGPSTGTVGQDGLSLSGTTGGAVSGARSGTSNAPPGEAGTALPGGVTGTTTGATVGAGTGGQKVPGAVTATATARQGLASKEPIRLGVIYTPGVDQAA